ncbi:unnamed protein product, partial [Arabidopsis halleri]
VRVGGGRLRRFGYDCLRTVSSPADSNQVSLSLRAVTFSDLVRLAFASCGELGCHLSVFFRRLFSGGGRFQPGLDCKRKAGVSLLVKLCLVKDTSNFAEEVSNGSSAISELRLRRKSKGEWWVALLV